MAPEHDSRSFLAAGKLHPAVAAWRKFFVDSYVEAVESQSEPSAHRPTLLNSVEAWLTHGNAVQVCGDYDTYLVIVSTIIALWTERHLPFDEGGNHDAILRLLKFRKRQYKVPWENIPVAALRYEVWKHPALSRTSWDLARARHANQ